MSKRSNKVGTELSDRHLHLVQGGGVTVGTTGDYNVAVDLKPLAELGKKVFKEVKKFFKDLF